MGVGYYEQLVQWSKGEYANANNTEDDIQIIQNNGALLMADDHGNGQASSTALDNTTDGITVTLSGSGLIERRTDVDFFSFMSGSGDISINVNPAQFSPNLDILAELYDSGGTLISSSNPVESLPASISEIGLPAGEYFIMVDGIGKGDPLGTGYTDYASLGKYTISGSVPDAGGLQFPVAVATATPPLNGPAPFMIYLFGNQSFDTDGEIQSHEWNFGDGSDASLLEDTSHTYFAPGNYTATLTVTDNDGLTNSATVDIIVENRLPIAVASADPTSGTAPLTINFDSTGSNDPDQYGTIIGYSWDFGDGNGSTAANPEHTYNAAGIFIAELTVTDDIGDIGTDTVTITVSPSPIVDQYATGENYVSGTVTGSYTNTFADDGTTESIRERESGGKPGNRHSFLEHVWIVPVQPGNSVTLFINARQSSSVDSDTFDFAYSVDGGATYTDPVVTIDPDTNSEVSVPLPPTTVGDILIRVKDTDRQRGNRSLDTVFVNKLYIKTENQPGGNPPAKPSDLIANADIPGQVDLGWKDNADNEYGFYIERSTDEGVSWSMLETVEADAQDYSDTDVTGSTAYRYRVAAYNGSGQSEYVESADVTPEDPVGSIELSADGYKRKGNKMVDLTWSGTTNEVHIYRDGIVIYTTDTGAYTDNLGKGGGSYTYQVCEPDTSNCSNSVTVTF
jgi:PKD repeat protein